MVVLIIHMWAPAHFKFPKHILFPQQVRMYECIEIFVSQIGWIMFILNREPSNTLYGLFQSLDLFFSLFIIVWLQGPRMKKEVIQNLETISSTKAMRVSNKRQRLGSCYSLPTLVSFSSGLDMDEGNSSVSMFS